MKVITPINDVVARMPEQGRIRIGQKGSRGEPQKIDKFRFTSHDEQAIREIAALYGGVATPWKNGPRPGEWEVFTESKEVGIALPPDPLGDSPIYELWSGGGRQRSCDGETCSVAQTTGDGAEIVEVPCLCSNRGRLECKVTTRLNVILRNVRFGGSWRLESHGWNVAHEVPGMVQLIEAYQQRGIVRAVLTLAERKSVKNGKTRRFNVPALGFEAGVDIEALAAGSATLGALAPAPPPLALLPGVDDDDEGSLPFDDEPAEADEVLDPSRQDLVDQVERAIVAFQKRVDLDPDVDAGDALTLMVSLGTCEDTDGLTDDQLRTLLRVLNDHSDGRRHFKGINDQGWTTFTRP